MFWLWLADWICILVTWFGPLVMVHVYIYRDISWLPCFHISNSVWFLPSAFVFSFSVFVILILSNLFIFNTVKQIIYNIFKSCSKISRVFMSIQLDLSYLLPCSLSKNKGMVQANGHMSASSCKPASNKVEYLSGLMYLWKLFRHATGNDWTEDIIAQFHTNDR